MRRCYWFLSIFTTCFLMFFMFTINVSASDCSKYGCATCVYDTAGGKATYDIKANGDGSVTVVYSSVLENGTEMENNVADKAFVNTIKNVLNCYPIYQVVTALPRGQKVTLTSDSTIKNAAKQTASSDSTNNNLPLKLDIVKKVFLVSIKILTQQLVL